MRYLLVACSVIASFLILIIPAHADELDEIQKKIDDLTRAKQMSEQAVRPLEGELTSLKKQIDDIFAQLQSAERAIIRKQQELNALEKEITEESALLDLQKDVFEDRVRSYYMHKRLDVPFLLFLRSGGVDAFFRALSYKEAAARQDRAVIIDISEKLALLEQKKKGAVSRKLALERDKARLASLKEKADERAGFLKGEISKAKAYQEQLTTTIAELTARQQAIIAARSGTSITSVGEVPIGSDFNASIGFKAQAPADSFAVFSFGAYTHRNGMSQYGAKARAEAGQSAKDILSTYFPGSKLNENYDIPATIAVQGYGAISFKDYLLGIYEMPESWPLDALKAQAVMARTYAIRASKPICTTEACQVYKPSPKSGRWKEAVEATERWVLEDIPNAQYSSTAGGYLNNSGWDTTDKSNSGDWTTRAWETKGSSPWFYKSWYRSSYRNDGPSCGRSHPWLSQEEFSDIINAAIVLSQVQQDERILPTTIGQCAVGGSGAGNPYSTAELAQKASLYGGTVTRVNEASVSHNDTGETVMVKLNTNRGSIEISGSNFKRAFNLRAPGYISIPQSGFAFFNIEKK